MITKWRVFNFKSIREETELELGPLTIFAGANSSGKSTFIQSILLVAQTVAHKVGARSVVLNGALTSLGQFDDLKSYGTESDQITIKSTFKPISEDERGFSSRSVLMRSGTTFFGSSISDIKEVTSEISFDADPSSPDKDLYQIQPRLFSSELSCTFRDEDKIDQTTTINIRQSIASVAKIDGVDVVGDLDEQLRSSLSYDVLLDESSLAEIHEDYKTAIPIGCNLKHFLPVNMYYKINSIQEEASNLAIILQDDDRRTMRLRNFWSRDILLSHEVVGVLKDILKNIIDFDIVFKEKQQKLFFNDDTDAMPYRLWHETLRSMVPQDRMKILRKLRECDDLFERIYAAMKVTENSPEIKYSVVQERPPQRITEASRYIDSFFSKSLKYLGPLRDAPKPLYPLAPTADPHDVGLRGEHTASILELHKNKKIQYIPSEYFKAPEIDRKMVTRTLEAAVIDWLQYLGVASSVRSRDQGKLGHELKVALSNSDITHDLTHVGVGVSQVLPILVTCLLADTDSTLVFEQPELHLHPKVQTLLGDFFLSMALCNKQCIVETHSEYFIDRLRFRIAAASPEKELNSQAKIYFVEKPSQGSSFREVVINEYGAIPDWPDDFFDQSQKLAEEILRAAAKKRKANRGNKDA